MHSPAHLLTPLTQVKGSWSGSFDILNPLIRSIKIDQMDKCGPNCFSYSSTFRQIIAVKKELRSWLWKAPCTVSWILFFNLKVVVIVISKVYEAFAGGGGQALFQSLWHPCKDRFCYHFYFSHEKTRGIKRLRNLPEVTLSESNGAGSKGKEWEVGLENVPF